MTDQPSFFDPVMPYGGHVPSANKDTSRAAASALETKLGQWQRKVLVALFENGPLSDEALEVILDCVRTRTSRPRRRELELAGYVEDSGKRVIGLGGTAVVLWQLTERGSDVAAGMVNR